MKGVLIAIFSLILIAMLAVTTWASLYENVVAGGAKLIAEPWGVATLFDAYFGFITFWLWVCFKECSNVYRALWFVLIMLFGNIAMAIYVLMEISRVSKNTSFTFENLMILKKKQKT